MVTSTAAGRQPAAAPAFLLAALLLCCAARPAAAHKKEPPPTMNPYANAPYAGCDGGYCRAADPALEVALYRAAASGDAAAVGALLANPGLNTTRNIVPDADGFVRVIDAAVWAAAKHGKLEAMQALLAPGYEADYEDGHVVDLAGEWVYWRRCVCLWGYRGFALESSAGRQTLAVF